MAEDVGGMARFHIVKLFEREIGISNWHLNMEVVCHRRAYRTENVPYILRHSLHPCRSEVLAACRRSICTFSEPQAID